MTLVNVGQMTDSDAATPALLHSISLPTAPTPLSLNILAGTPVFVVGRNGTGKSALLHQIYKTVKNPVAYFPGSRQVYIESEPSALTKLSSQNIGQNLEGWNQSHEIRFKPVGGTSRNDKAMYDLLHVETKYCLEAAEQIKREGSSSEAIARLQSNCSPLDKLNALLKESNVPISLLVQNGDLKAKQRGNIYSFIRLSDGERAALLFIAGVITAPIGTTVIIDEPELYLHPSITIALFKAVLRQRPDCGFIVSTHALDLPIAFPDAPVISVRSCTWNDINVSSWEMDYLPKMSVIPEWLRLDVLGARKKILFVEGTDRSLDTALYSILFPSVSVSSRESCQEVKKAVRALREIPSFHHVEAFGIVDLDGMNQVQIDALEADGIYPLKVFSVESIYYSLEVQKALAEAQSKVLGEQANKLLNEASRLALAAADQPQTIEYLASRIAEYDFRANVFNQMPERKNLIASEVLCIKVESTFPSEHKKLKEFLATGDIHSIISRYPVRQSGILSGISKGLGFSDTTVYEKAALYQIGSNETLRETLKLKLGRLGKLLGDQPQT